MYRPSLEEFRRLARGDLLVPVTREIFSDLDTPVSAFMKVDDGRYGFLLESVEGGEKWGRYSFLGSRPAAVFRARDRRVEIERDGRTEVQDNVDPLAVLEHELLRRRAVPMSGLPRFTGGAVGYLGYDVVRHIERVPSSHPDELGVPDAVFLFSDVVTIFDNHTHTLKVVTHARGWGDPEKEYAAARDRLDAEVERLLAPLAARPVVVGGPAPEVVAVWPEAGFEAAVERAKEYIRAGDIFQVVLAHRLSAPMRSAPFDAYRALRVVNPSPYMYFLRLGDMALAGSSPEVLVRHEDGNVEVRPIAGTRPRGATPDEDAALERELSSDEKERAEHVMLLDLGRNDVGRVSRFGSVRVTESFIIERYSQVMHLVSNVRGRLAPDLTPMQVVRACFPAGTVSGAPKVRAMEIIDELEPTRRGVYAGAVGYFDLHGNLDLAIAIRTLLLKDGRAHLGVGAGIVYDSVPEREYAETMSKGKALLQALERAELGLETVDGRQV
ncbi:MAG TPA: anthranilate synthase component I [Candidatus Eisenbacteria bacterium]|nr:anthranilate synthase component I [Candidatus Eisenbacteria bacterium]